MAALKLLARREVSEAQVRQRLVRRRFELDAIEDAIARLKDERAIDDTRVAETIARTQMAIKKRGKLRVRQQIESAGVGSTTAQRVVDRLFDEVDDEDLFEAALARRLGQGEAIADERQFARLSRYLVAQGFDPELVMRMLDARRRIRTGE
jgi:regulatory protein